LSQRQIFFILNKNFNNLTHTHTRKMSYKLIKQLSNFQKDGNREVIFEATPIPPPTTPPASPNPFKSYESVILKTFTRNGNESKDIIKGEEVTLALQYIYHFYKLTTQQKKYLKHLLETYYPLNCFYNEFRIQMTLKDSRFVVEVKGITDSSKLNGWSNHGNNLHKDLIYPVLILKKYNESLMDWIINTNRKKRRTYCKWIFKQLLWGLKDIHNHDIIHFDIRPSNILIESVFHCCKVKYCDFGNSIFKKEKGEYKYNYLCTPWFRPPERWLRKDFDESVDIYSLGCTFYVLYVGDFLFRVKDENDIMGNVKVRSNDKVRNYLQKRVKDNELFIKLVLSMVNYDRFKRPSIDDCLNHKFFKLY